jgi:cytochrome c
VHPSFRLSSLRPESFKPMVGGLAFLPDGRLLVSTWDARGSVFMLGNLSSPDPERITVKEIASGLNEPLGLDVLDGVPYVLQKHELTKLLDTNGDDIVDEYRTVTDGWQVSSNFHEFAFGLVQRDGSFYATLATAILPGGASKQPQLRDRGRVMRIDARTGAVDFMADGLRTPNGIGPGVDGELFVSDNQGDWLPANKIVRVERDAFYGSYSVDPVGRKNTPVTPPFVWLPQDELANSPSQTLRLDVGPYRNQTLYGDVTHGGLNRIAAQKIDGHYQGCVMPFTQGLEAGINRAIVGPDGALYVGGIGNPGNWGHEGKLWYGLQKLTYTGAPAFEMLDVQMRSDGIEITFTEPLRVGDGDAAADYEVKQWHYVPTAEYGGPKVGEHALAPRAAHVSPDRRRVFLEVTGVKPGHVVYLRLANPMIAESNRELWATEAWCTVNALPKDSPGDRFGSIPAPTANVLTEAEKAAGWRLLFDGRTTKGWHPYGKKGAIKGWKAADGTLALARNGGGGDIVTDEAFGDFELELEWQIAEGGNSGIFYRVAEGAGEIWHAAPEMQVLDDERHDDRESPVHRAGAAYDLYAPRAGAVRRAGEFNKARLLVRGTTVEHWLNGHKVVAYDTESAQWKKALAASKFAEFPQFSAARKGRIGLQDHDDAVRYRNIKIRPL